MKHTVSLQSSFKFNAIPNAPASWSIGAVIFNFPLLCMTPILDVTIGHSCTRTSSASTLKRFGYTSP